MTSSHPRSMEDHGQKRKDGVNAFHEHNNKERGYQPSGADEDRDPKRLKPNSLPIPNLLVSAFKDNPTSGVKFQLFVSRSYTPPTSTAPPPVYTLKVTSDSSAEVEPVVNRVDGGATPVVTETRLVAEGQFRLRSRL